jgi:hypothetical protein
VYLFEINIPPLNIQKNHRELEVIVQECILNTLRESIPVEAILKAYMDETIEEDVVEEIKEQIIEQPQKQEQPQPQKVDTTGGNKVGFNDIDYVSSSDGKVENIVVPKTYENLDYISNMRAEQRKQDEANDSDDDNIKISISDEMVSPESVGLLSIEEPKMDLFIWKRTKNGTMEKKHGTVEKRWNH